MSVDPPVEQQKSLTRLVRERVRAMRPDARGGDPADLAARMKALEARVKALEVGGPPVTPPGNP